MGDEDVIRRRLLIDGDGTGDDRRLNVLLKSFIKWCNTSGDSPSESQIMQDRMIAQLSQCEYAFAKSRLSADMSALELQNYENLSKQIEEDIENAKKEIESTKLKLREAKTVRKNRVEYEVFAKIINEQPDRKQTHDKLSMLQKELQNLEETRELLEKKLDQRRKQFYVLVASIQQLQALLNDEDEDSNDASMDVMNVDDDDEDVKIEKTVVKNERGTVKTEKHSKHSDNGSSSPIDITALTIQGPTPMETVID